MKHLWGAFNQPSCHGRPFFSVDWNAPCNNLHQDQDMEEPGAGQSLMNGVSRCSFSQIAFEQLRLSLFNSRETF